jgi:cytochrome c-type biogenesis protein CcmE
MSQAMIDHPSQIPESTGSSHRLKVLVGLAVVVASLGYLGFMAFESATLYYYTVSELRDVGPTEGSRDVRVSGKLVPGSFVRAPDSTLASFTLTDGTATIDAVHDGVLPDLFFNDLSEIILEGTHLRDGTFQSRFVTVKCPSKYIAVE